MRNTRSDDRLGFTLARIWVECPVKSVRKGLTASENRITLDPSVLRTVSGRGGQLMNRRVPTKLRTRL